MLTTSRQCCILGALLLLALGCGADAPGPRAAGEEAKGGHSGGGGASTAGSAKSGGGGTHNKGGSSSATPSSTTGKAGGETIATDPGEDPGEKEEGTGGAGGRSDGKGGSAMGGSVSTKGGALGTGGATKVGTTGLGGKTSGTGGGSPGTGGKTLGTGGSISGAGGSSGGADASTELDCAAAMPTGGTQHSGNGQGGKDNLAWQIWSNAGSGTLTTFSTPSFSAAWNNSGDYLGRLGFEWGNAGKAYTSYGTIKAQYTFKKTGTGGAYSYIGIYGWSTNPCIEWYIVEDSFSAMPFNTGTAPSGTADIDGGTYNLVKRNTSGTGGNRCGSVSNWDQFYSIRTKSKTCGTITISEHFSAWDAKGWKLGNLLEAKILVEAGGGSGSVDFPIANVTTSP